MLSINSMHSRSTFTGAALLLVACVLLSGSPVLADEWNDAFSPPRPYRVLRDIAVRNGPSNDAQRLGSISKDDVVRVHEIVNGWNRFDYLRQQGWVFKRYLRPMAAGELQETKVNAAEPAEVSAPEKSPVQQALAELEQNAADTPPPPEEPAEAPPEQDGGEQLVESDPLVQTGEAPPPETTPQAQEQLVVEEEALAPAADDAPPQEEPEGTEPVAVAAIPEKERPAPLPEDLPEADVSACERFISLRVGEKSKQAYFEGNLGAGEKACFRILALEDWTLEITLQSDTDDARFDVFTPQAQRLATDMKAWAHIVERSGDKQVVVYTIDKPARYTLSILVR